MKTYTLALHILILVHRAPPGCWLHVGVAKYPDAALPVLKKSLKEEGGGGRGGDSSTFFF